MFRTVNNPQYSGAKGQRPSRGARHAPAYAGTSSYGDGGFWRVAQNSQALGRYNGIRRNRAAGGGSMPYGMIGLGAVPAPILAIGAVFLAVGIYGYFDQKGRI